MGHFFWDTLYILIRVGTMEVDVEVREVSSWGIKVLLRNETSVSDTTPQPPLSIPPNILNRMPQGRGVGKNLD